MLIKIKHHSRFFKGDCTGYEIFKFEKKTCLLLISLMFNLSAHSPSQLLKLFIKKINAKTDEKYVYIYTKCEFSYCSFIKPN